MFVISIDTDWALQPILEDTVNLLNDFNLKSTIFLTNKIDHSFLSNHELAIHPNYEGFSNQEEVIKKTLKVLPSQKTKGSRSHKFYYNSPLMAIYEKLGIEYDSNYYMPSVKKPEPFFFEWVDILEIPVFFCDDAHFMKSSKFDLSDLDMEDSGVKVFLFHPFHIFMNTDSEQSYQKMKPNYQEYDFLYKNRQLNSQGTRNLFMKILEYIEKNGIETKTMAEINDIWRRNKKS